MDLTHTDRIRNFSEEVVVLSSRMLGSGLWLLLVEGLVLLLPVIGLDLTL